LRGTLRRRIDTAPRRDARVCRGSRLDFPAGVACVNAPRQAPARWSAEAQLLLNASAAPITVAVVMEALTRYSNCGRSDLAPPFSMIRSLTLRMFRITLIEA
jgi:hypothetical protein